MIQCSVLGLHGRLGNALFQFASTVALGTMRGEQIRFPANWLHRPYFRVPDRFFGLVPGVREASTVPELSHMDERVRIYMQDVTLIEPVMDFVRDWLRPSRYAQLVLQEFEEFFKLPRPILSVHVRRGDNVPGQDPGVRDKHNYFVLPTQGYYLDAITHFGDSPASRAVFSDDIDWCKTHIPADYYHSGVARPKEHETDFLSAPVLDWIDLQLMAQCDYHVVTGSTFGIWGALLAGKNQVVRATPVYGPKLNYINEDILFPKLWTKLEVQGAFVPP